MNTLRVRAFMVLALLGALLGTTVVLMATQVSFESVGRRADRSSGPLPAALHAVAQLEVLRLGNALQEVTTQVEESFRHALSTTGGPVTPDAPVPWKPGLCTRLVWPDAVERAGVVEVPSGTVLSLVELERDRCVDRTATLAVQAVTGPPFPSAAEVTRMSEMALVGSDRASDGVRVVAVHREGVRARVRLARRQQDRVVFADVDLGRLAPAAAPGGVQVHALLLLDGVPAGYVLGGPEEDAVQGAMKDVKRGTGRALDLPDVAEASAAGAVDAWLQPARDPETHALAGARLALDGSLGLELAVVAAAPWPPASAPVRLERTLMILVTAAAWLLLLMLSLRRLAGILWATAQEVRQAWLGLRDDDVGSKEDAERARSLLATLTNRTQELLVVAYGKGERFWSPGPIKRLLQVLRRKMDG